MASLAKMFARYYRRRAEGGAGLIITEGTFNPALERGA